MSDIILRQSAVDHLTSDPAVRHWRQHKSGREVPFLGYYRRSYSTARDGMMTEYGDGFMLTTINPQDGDETKDIVIQLVIVESDFHILVGGEDEIMSKSFAIGWNKKFTYEPSTS